MDRKEVAKDRFDESEDFEELDTDDVFDGLTSAED